MKKLVLEAQKVTIGGECKIRFKIKEQTHRGYEFGYVQNASRNEFKATNGIEIVSSSYPETRSEKLFVRGSDPYKDCDTIDVSEELFNRYAQAVHEYNKFFSDEEVLGEKFRVE